MKWHLETWRKLYVAKSPAWLRLPVSARGLGRELLTYCDDAGRIDIGTDAPGEAIAYLLGARPKEHKRIAEDVAALLADGYLVHEGTDLVVRNFVEAQDRTPAAKRTAEWRARKNGAPASLGDAPRTVTGDVTCDVRETSREPSPETLDVTATRAAPFRVVPCRPEDPPEPSSPLSPPGGATGGGGAFDVLRRALGAHRKFAGIDLDAMARDLADELTMAAATAGRPKSPEQLTRDVADAAFVLPEHPNETAARSTLRGYVVRGGWGDRQRPLGPGRPRDRATRVQGGADEIEAVMARAAARRAAAGEEDPS